MKNQVLIVLAVTFVHLTGFAGAAPQDTKTFFRSFSTLQQFIQLYRKDSKPVPFFGMGTQKDPEPVPPEVIADAEKLKSLVGEEACQIIMPEEKTLTVGQGDMQGSVTTFVLEIKGDKCPLYIKVSVQATQSDNMIDGEFWWEYKALHDDFKQEADIYEVKEIGKIYANVVPGSASQQLVLNFFISGKGLSQKYGAFNIEHAFESDFKFNFPLDLKADVKAHHNFQFKQDDIQLKRDTHIDGIFSIQEKYYSNGQEVDLATYSDLAQGIQFVGIGETKDASDLPPLSCEFKAVDKSTGRIVTSVSSCMKEARATGFHNQDFYEVSLNYTENWVEAKLLQLNTNRSDVLTALYEESSDFKKDFGSLQMQLFCEPVPKCP